MWRDVGAGSVRVCQDQRSSAAGQPRLILLAIAAFFLAYAIAIFLPQRATHAALRQEREQLQRQISTATTDLTTLSAGEGTSLDSATRLAQEVPSNDHIPALIEELLFQSRQVGLTLATIKRQPDRVSESLNSLSLAIVAHGNYEQLTTFLGGLEQMTRLVDVVVLRIRTIAGSAADVPVLEATLELRTYCFVDAAPARVVTAVEELTGDG